MSAYLTTEFIVGRDDVTRIIPTIYIYDGPITVALKKAQARAAYRAAGLPIPDRFQED